MTKIGNKRPADRLGGIKGGGKTNPEVAGLERPDVCAGTGTEIKKQGGGRTCSLTTAAPSTYRQTRKKNNPEKRDNQERSSWKTDEVHSQETTAPRHGRQHRHLKEHGRDKKSGRAEMKVSKTKPSTLGGAPAAAKGIRGHKT